jgi:photosystem II stability/assembly factor-like uncharacterized protein
MKIMITLILLLFSLQVNAQWRWINPYPHGSDFNSVYFISSSTGWIGASDGKIFKTTDGGNSWEEKSVTTVWNTIKDIYFLNENTGIAAGRHYFDGDVKGFIINTLDGGANWNIIYTESSPINGLAFSSSLIGYAAGDEVIYKSTDQGVTWFKQFEHPFNLSDVYAVSDMVVAAGSDGAILRTTNAGSSWHIVSSGTAQDLNRIYFINNLTGFAVGSSGTIIKTTNAGLSWTNVNSSTSEDLTSIVFTSPANGIITGNNGIILRTTNGGSSWELRNSIPDRNFYSIYMLNSNSGIAAGSYGLKAVTTDGGESWSTDYKPVLNSGEVYEGMLLDQNTVLLTASSGIFRSSDRGNTWTLNPDFSFYDISFADSYNGLGFRSDDINGTVFSQLARTSDGGKTWFLSLYDSLRIYSTSFVSNSTIAYMTAAEKNHNLVLYKTTNGGINWTVRNNSAGFYNIHFFNENSGVGILGDQVFRTTDGGLNWTDQNAPYLYDGISYISFAKTGHGIAASHEGGWIRTTNYGVTWTIGSGGALSHILGVSITDRGNITITSGCWNPIPVEGGAIMRSTDFGQTWSLYRTQRSFSRINFLNDNNGIITGSGYVIAFSDQDFVPVELAGFNASINGDDVHLTWNTITETNNKGFEIERKSDLGFAAISFIPGAGSSSELKSYSYIDKDIQPGEYIYRLRQIDYDGTFAYSQEILVDYNSAPQFSLSQCYPNPFNSTTRINYSVPSEGNTSLKIYDMLGQEVEKPFDEHKLKGNYTMDINASNLPTGIYFYRLKSGNHSSTKKMILLK